MPVVTPRRRLGRDGAGGVHQRRRPSLGLLPPLGPVDGMILFDSVSSSTFPVDVIIVDYFTCSSDVDLGGFGDLMNGRVGIEVVAMMTS